MYRPTVLKALSLCLLAALGTGCGSDSDDVVNLFILRGARGAVDTALPTAVGGDWIVYFEKETPGGAGLSPGNLNSNGAGTDTDSVDSVAVAIRVSTDAVTQLGVAARSAHIIGNEIYLEVSEADDTFDWNGDGMPDDIVLLHWSLRLDGVPNDSGMCNAATVCYVDDLDPNVVAPSVLVTTAGGRVYYTSGISDGVLAGLGGGGTSLRYLEASAPMMREAVTHTDSLNGQRRPRIIEAHETGLLVLALDENVEMLNLNGDTDGTPDDEAVLALLDGTDPDAEIKSVELAMPLRGTSPNQFYSPVKSILNNVTGELLVGFFVSEAAQDSTGTDSLNNSADFAVPAWQPSQCSNQDMDIADSVLHFLHFDTWFNDSSTNPPRNTGLVGRIPTSSEPDRVVVLSSGYVGTISNETSAGCILNVDGDMSDGIVRWTEAPLAPMAEILPPGAMEELHAVEIGLPGTTEGFSSMGVSALRDRFVIVVDEMSDNDDLDSSGSMGSDLVGWLDPASTTLTTWTFSHGGGFIGAGWMGDNPRSSRLPIAFQESVVGSSLNSACKSLTLVNDTDTMDEIPVFGRFSGSTTLVAPGVGVGMATGNPGILIEGGVAYFRASEASHNQDLNGDGDKDDFLLVRNSLLACAPVAMTVTPNPGTGDDLILTDGGSSAAVIGSEVDAGVDYNNNGNIGEDVLLFFRIP